MRKALDSGTREAARALYEALGPEQQRFLGWRALDLYSFLYEQDPRLAPLASSMASKREPPCGEGREAVLGVLIRSLHRLVNDSVCCWLLLRPGRCGEALPDTLPVSRRAAAAAFFCHHSQRGHWHLEALEAGLTALPSDIQHMQGRLHAYLQRRR